MYSSIKSKVLFNGCVSEDITCSLGVRQGECLSPFLFAIYVNDLEETFDEKNHSGVDIGMLKLFLLIYADDIVLFAESALDLQSGLDILKDYCDKWKLIVNTNKTKVMIFRKGGRNNNTEHFIYNGNAIEIVDKFTYLGIVFSSGGSFRNTYSQLADQA